jgi:PAS domain S-box-containing protein
LKRLAYSLAYPAIGLISIAWLVFAIQYTGRLREPTKGEFAGLGVVPVLTTVAALTNQYHGLIWSSVDITARGQIELMITSPGILFWVHALQSYALIGLGTALIVGMAITSGGAYRSEGFALILAAAFPLVANLLYLTETAGTVDLTPAAFALSGTVLTAVVFRDQFLQSLPMAREIARDEFIKQVGSPLVVLDRRARVVDANPAAESLTDSTAGSIGSRIESAFPDIAAAIDLDDESTQRTSLVRTDGETDQHYEVEKLPLHRGGGAVRGHLIRLNNITGLKNRQQELIEERQFIDQALDALDDLFYVLDVDGNLRRWNKQFSNITGYSESELERMHALDFFPDEDRKTIADAVEATLQHGETTVEADLLTAEGTQIPHEFTGARLEDKDGTPTGLVGIGRDISDRKERERRLRTFREAVENAGRMIYWMDDEGTVEYVNPVVERQTGYDASEFVGKQTLPLINKAVTNEAQPDTLADDVLDTLSRGETWQGEFSIRRSEGTRLTIDQIIKPVSDNGEIERFVAVAGDITEKKRRTQQLSVLQRILRHDLRNNLNELLLSVQLAGREATNDAVQQQLEGAEQTIAETLSLSQDVRRFKRAFETGEIDKRAVDIVETAREQVARLRAERPNVDCSVEPSGSVRVVTTDLIDRAIRNVLRNAVEHNDSEVPEVRVTLTRRPESDQVALKIADNGPGIPDETVEVLDSDREEQLDHLDGFGLWLAQWVLTLSGGTLEFAENTPRGTVVTLVLPAHQVADNQHIAQ